MLYLGHWMAKKGDEKKRVDSRLAQKRGLCENGNIDIQMNKDV